MSHIRPNRYSPVQFVTSGLGGLEMNAAQLFLMASMLVSGHAACGHKGEHGPRNRAESKRAVDEADNCPLVVNGDQLDTDEDGGGRLRRR